MLRKLVEKIQFRLGKKQREEDIKQLLSEPEFEDTLWAFTVGTQGDKIVLLFAYDIAKLTLDLDQASVLVATLNKYIKSIMEKSLSSQDKAMGLVKDGIPRTNIGDPPEGSQGLARREQ